MTIKKMAWIMAVVIFALGVLTTSVYRASAQTLESQNTKLRSLRLVVADEEEEATPEAKKVVDYELTYPGILPNHPLYPLKMIRDRIWLFLTTDPLKKADLLLTLADKRIWAAQLLLEKEKVDLAVSTATKAEKYLERALNQGKAAQGKGKDARSFWEKFSQASLKHEEVLLNMEVKIEGEAATILEETLKYPREGYQQATKFLEE